MLLTDILQHFGLAEVSQVNADGELRRRYFGPEYIQFVDVWAPGEWRFLHRVSPWRRGMKSPPTFIRKTTSRLPLSSTLPRRSPSLACHTTTCADLVNVGGDFIPLRQGETR